MSTGMLAVVLVLVLGLIAALALRIRGSSDDEPGAVTSDGGAVSIGPAGGTATFTSDAGADLTLAVPAGALAAEVGIELSTRPVEWTDVTALADDHPGAVEALADHAVNDDDSLIHPLYGPVVLPANSQMAPVEIVLEPDGLQFAQPAVLTVSAAEFGLAAGDEVLLFVESQDDWEVHDLGIVPDDGRLAIDIEHFSTDKLVKIIGNMWDNPMMHPSREAYRDALDVLYDGPLETQAATMQRALACGTDRKFDASSIPPFTDLLLYLASDGGRGISTAPAGAGDRIRDQLVAMADATRPPGVKIQDWAATLAPHDVDLGTLVSMAMEETDNDVFQALVLAHDVLRANRENVRVQGVMANVRGDGGDERGGRYHILGMAIYSFAYQHQKQTTGGSWWAPSPETAALMEEAWVSGDINSDTVEYALDRYGARLGRTLLEDYQLTDEERRELCEYLDLVAPTTTTTVVQQPETYAGVEFPKGEISFADTVIEFTGAEGVESPFDSAANALGPPNDDHVSLGNATAVCETYVTFEFVDNYLVDVEGPDLWIYEVGPAVEATDLFISDDLSADWTGIGRIEGSTRTVDIAGFIAPGERYRYVRLCDHPDGETSGSPFAGPDIAAVGAIGTVWRPLDER